MPYYDVGNRPDISAVCGDSSISRGPIAANVDETGQLWGWESLMTLILVNASLLSASC